MIAEIAQLLEMDVVSPSGETRTLSLCDTTVPRFAETDPDRPGQEYDQRLITAPTITREMTLDPARLDDEVGYGAAAVDDADGALSWLRGWRITEVRCYRGIVGQPWALYRRWLIGRGGIPRRSVSADDPARLVVNLYDARLDLEDDIERPAYGGTNSGPASYDGTADDIKGRWHPLALGVLQCQGSASGGHVPATWVNTASRVAQLSIGPIGGVSQIYQAGGPVGLIADPDVTGAVFDGATPAASHYRTDNARGLVKFNTSFGGQIGVDLIGVADAGITAASAIRWLLRRRGVQADRIGVSFDTVTTPTVGLWIGTDATPYRDAIALLRRSGALWCHPDRLGVWQIGKIVPPAGTQLTTWTDNDLVDLADDDDDQAPVWSVTVEWGRNYLPLRGSEVAGALRGTARETWVGQEVRTVTRTSSAAKLWPGARTVTIPTALVTEADATALADHLLSVGSLRPDGTPWQRWRLVVEETATALDLDLGHVGRLASAEQGIDRLVTILGVRPGDPEPGLITYRVWG